MSSNLYYDENEIRQNANKLDAYIDLMQRSISECTKELSALTKDGLTDENISKRIDLMTLRMRTISRWLDVERSKAEALLMEHGKKMREQDNFRYCGTAGSAIGDVIDSIDIIL